MLSSPQSVNVVVVSRESSPEERQAALYQIYAQVLERQPYAFEHKMLAKPEKDFIRDKIGVKRFLKILGHSEVYLEEFYHRSSNLKFIELCFKHFMGRAPKDHEEVHHYCDILLREGVEKLITRLIDSEEYLRSFGCFTVPYPRTERQFNSPKAYLESDALLHELHGRRGTVVPTMTWHELHLDCNGGTCGTAPPAGALPVGQPLPVVQPGPEDSLSQVHSALKNLNRADISTLAASLSDDERSKLKQILLQSI